MFNVLLIGLMVLNGGFQASQTPKQAKQEVIKGIKVVNVTESKKKGKVTLKIGNDFYNYNFITK